MEASPTLSLLGRRGKGGEGTRLNGVETLTRFISSSLLSGLGEEGE